MLYIDKTALYDAAGQRFDPLRREWIACEASSASPSPSGAFSAPHVKPVLSTAQAVSAKQALVWLQKKSGTPIRPPVAIIGPREADAEQLRMAYTAGRALAELGMHVLCGGRQGVMEASCQGVAEGGGISVGLLPEGEWTSANPYVTVPIATGIGIARNALIARAALCVIAVGGGLGTLSEIALSLQFGKEVFTLCRAPEVEGSHPFADWESLEPVLCAAILHCKGQSLT